MTDTRDAFREAADAAVLALADSRALIMATPKRAYYERAPKWERDIDLTIGVLHRLSIDAGNQDKAHYEVLEGFVTRYGTAALLSVLGEALKG